MLPTYLEDHVSQLPALKLLVQLGYDYISEKEVAVLRGNRTSGVLLEPILRQKLAELNEVRYQGKVFPFSDSAIAEAVRRLRDLPWSTGFRACQKEAYDLLTLGIDLEQTVLDSKKSHKLRFIDWERPEHNAFHVVEEYSVTRSSRADTYRPDIVVLVNGIPLVVIECKGSTEKDPIGQALEQHMRNQQEDGIRPLYAYASLVLGLAMNLAKYGTGMTAKKFFAIWREHYTPEEEAQLLSLKAKPLEPETEAKLFSERFAYAHAQYRAQAKGEQTLTEQDRLLYNLCRPERLLELTRDFTLFEAQERKIARYQQYFVIKRTLEKIGKPAADGTREGGVIWHTQGSGKSLTMVMMAEQIAKLPGIRNPKILIVTDRVDLDDQIKGTLAKCEIEVTKAATGQNLAQLLTEESRAVVTTIINKFEAVVRLGKVLDSPNIFVLIDEAHRTQHGTFAVKMRQVFPRACFIAFTGTPLFKKDKSTASKFGGILNPIYSITDAVADGAVVPLLYEGRHSRLYVDARPLDNYFNRMAEPLTDYGKEELKKRSATRSKLFESEEFIRNCAWDIITHFQQNVQGLFKGQLVAPSKLAAVRYYREIKAAGRISAELIISPPDTREGEEDPFEEADDGVKKFYKAMMDKYGNKPEEYEKSIINAFKNGETPEMIIVVDKLLTGFDAPRNQVLYLTRQLRDHTLLQAIARVNRLCEGKDYGLILDYVGNLGNLDEALTSYLALDGFEEKDLAGTITNVQKEVDGLPQLHAELWEVFKTVRNKYDVAAYENLLYHEDRRHTFYEKLGTYARVLKLALSSVQWVSATPLDRQQKFKEDLKFFMSLRESVKLRYSDATNFKEYENQVRKLLDKHITSDGEVLRLTDQVNIFDPEAFKAEVEKMESPASKADFIASRTAKKIEANIGVDPAFAMRISQLLQRTIDDFHQDRISELEYLNRVRAIQEEYEQGGAVKLPDAVNSPTKRGLYHMLESIEGIERQRIAKDDLAELTGQLDEVIRQVVFADGKPLVDWVRNQDVQARLKQAIDDYLFDHQESGPVKLSIAEIDKILDEALNLARYHYHG